MVEALIRFFKYTHNITDVDYTTNEQLKDYISSLDNQVDRELLISFYKAVND